MIAALNLVVLTLSAYLLGSIPFGVWLGWLFVGRDIRTGGSGHSGATNTLRQAGWAAGALALVLDFGKGCVAEWLALRFAVSPLTPLFAAAAVVAGHCWPVFAAFRGGMGLATAAGALLVAYPLGVALWLGLLIAGVLILRHGARGSLVSGLLIGPVIWLFTRSVERSLIGVFVGAVVAVRSFSDWRRVYRELWLDRERSPEGK